MYTISAVIENAQSRVALLDAEYKILQQKAGEASLLASLCADVMAEGGVNAADVSCIGVASDASAGEPAAVAALLEKQLGIKAVSADLMGAKALGEAYLTNDVSSLFLLCVGDAVECGVVIDRKLYTGTHLRGGNVAHMVIDFNGFECTCGNRGCFEAYAATAGLRRIAKEAGVAGADAITLVQLFGLDTPEAVRAQELYVKYFTAGITNLINLFQLEEFVLDGEFSKLGDKIMKQMMDVILREQFTHNMPNKCNVRFANEATDTALLGAALLNR